MLIPKEIKCNDVIMAVKQIKLKSSLLGRNRENCEEHESCQDLRNLWAHGSDTC